MKKLLVTLISASLLASMSVAPAHADAFTVTGITPENGSRFISAIEDVVINFSEEVNAATIKDGISITGNPTYQAVKDGNSVRIIFDKQLDYTKEYTVTLDSDLKSADGDSLTDTSFKFTTEYDPIDTLYYNDFENGDADLAKFVVGVDETPVEPGNGYYEIVDEGNGNHALKISRKAFSDYYPLLKGSSEWKEFDMKFDANFNNEGSRFIAILSGGYYGSVSGNNKTARGAMFSIFNLNQKNFIPSAKLFGNNTSTVDLTVSNGVTENENTHKYGYFPMEFMLTRNSMSPNQHIKASWVNKDGNTVIETGDYYSTFFGGVGLVSNYIASNGTPGNDYYIDDLIVTDPKHWNPRGNPNDPNAPVIRKGFKNNTIELLFPSFIAEGSGGKDSIKVKTLDGQEISRTIEIRTDPIGNGRGIYITLDSPKPDTTYVVTVPIDSVNTGSGGSNPVEMTNSKVFTVKTPYIPFSVAQTIPANNAVEVLANSNVKVKFSENVDFTTLTGNIEISPSIGFTVEETDDDTATLKFNKNLAYGTKYTVSFKDGIKDTNGKALTPSTLVFTTEESTFGVASTAPANNKSGVSVIEDLSITFTEEPDWDTLDGNITVSPAASFKIKKLSDTTAKLVFDNALEYNTLYKVALSGDITNASGVPMTTATINFRTAPNMGKALFYENFDGNASEAYNRFEEVGSDQRHESENFKVENGALVLPSWYSGGTNQAEKTVAKIKGSDDWSDISVEADVKIPSCRDMATTYGPSMTIGLRYGLYNDRMSFIGASIGDYSNNGIISASVTREGQSAKGKYAEVNNINSSTYDWIHQMISFNGIQGSAVVDYACTVDGTTYAKHFDSTKVPDGFDEAFVNGAGGVIFQTTSHKRNTYVDNIVVNDNKFYFTASDIKNNKGTATVTFNLPINESSLIDAVYVYDGEDLVDSTVTANANKLTIKVNKPESGKIYKVVLTKYIQSTTGLELTNDRYFEMSTLLDFAVKNLKIMSNGEEAKSLVGGAEISGYCEADKTTDGEQSMVLILAVYDNNGALYGVKVMNKSIVKDALNNTETDTIKLPSNVTGFKASVFCWDNLVNIRPISDVNTID